MPQRKQGILLAAAALLFWSTSSATTVWTGDQIGPWQFLGLSTLIAGIAQIFLYRRLGMPYKKILAPPPKLLALILSTFVLYMLVYTLALVLATKPQKVGVNLANFLWPTLTIVFATFLVPGSKMSPRLLLALTLALAGVLLANLQGLSDLIRAHHSSLVIRHSSFSLLPYILGLMAGITWALYSATLARWKNWSRNYATSPIGFLLTSLVCFLVCLATKTWNPMTPSAWSGTIYMALGPQAAAYLLWELALHRAPPHTLGLLASANAVLSTLWLFIIIPLLHGDASPPNYLHCILAASLIALAVLLGHRNPDRKRGPGKTEPVA